MKIITSREGNGVGKLFSFLGMEFRIEQGNYTLYDMILVQYSEGNSLLEFGRLRFVSVGLGGLVCVCADDCRDNVFL